MCRIPGNPFRSTSVATKKKPGLSKDVIASLRQKANESREFYRNKPNPYEFLTRKELTNAAPFYFVLRDYIHQLKQTREMAGLTLAQISRMTGMAVESLSRLENGALTNPTWKTLASYTAAVGRKPYMIVVPADTQRAEPMLSEETAYQAEISSGPAEWISQSEEWAEVA
jgi:transcriptional regulator with XRE-family HTH domain